MYCDEVAAQKQKVQINLNIGTNFLYQIKILNVLKIEVQLNSNLEKIKQSFVYGDKKTYLVALLVSESEENKKEIELYIENLNKPSCKIRTAFSTKKCLPDFFISLLVTGSFIFIF